MTHNGHYRMVPVDTHHHHPRVNSVHVLRKGVPPVATDRVERKLVAILAADMVAYSRLMEADETGTIVSQKTHRAELVDPEIATHGGRADRVQRESARKRLLKR